jgi:hypothetical protein
MEQTLNGQRTNKLQAIALAFGVALVVKVLLAILLEYRWYFPVDFDQSAGGDTRSNQLRSGRRLSQEAFS